MRHIATSLFVALWLTTATVAAQVPDCGRAYQGMLGTIERKKPTLSAEAQVTLQRMALRVYDACMTGHLEQPGKAVRQIGPDQILKSPDRDCHLIKALQAAMGFGCGSPTSTR
jgi:hypothetical protein